MDIWIYCTSEQRKKKRQCKEQQESRVTLIDIGFKSYTNILERKLYEEIIKNDTYSLTQFLYRKIRGTVDESFLLKMQYRAIYIIKMYLLCQLT